ncbi:hypothetical protein ACFL30_02150 [Candidatus Latescibacterota bacterium]
MPIALIIGGILAVVTAVILAAQYYARKRTEALQAVAASLGLSFTKMASDSFLPSLSRFHLFSQGRSRKVSNVISGSANEIDLTVFDYQYTTGAGKNSRTRGQTVVLLRSDFLRLPHFSLRPENLFHKIGKAFGYKDIDFDSHPAFSKEYLLRSEDEQACRDVFTKDVLRYYDKHQGLSTEGDGDSLLFYRASKKVRPAEVRSFVEDGFDVFRLFQAVA